MFSQTAEYALRAVVWLADQTESGPFGHHRIAAGTQVPATYLAKVLQELAKAGIVRSHRGVRGGFSLAQPPENLTVLDVIQAVDPIQVITTCPLKLPNHSHKLCGLHARLAVASHQFLGVLQQSTIKEMLSVPAHPHPLVDSAEEPTEA